MEWWALEAAGIDNWREFDFAIDLAEEDGYDFHELDDDKKLYYVQLAGVDNWNGYEHAQDLLEEEDPF